ncbi:MAG: hypothetical protein MI863_17060 [Desulfobacterales bacterium]|nr:hypothetical protein [Desulfobacterales bacterium]
MKIIIAPDIFGNTPALARLARKLEKTITGACVDIIDPYGENVFFRQEDEAYAYFTTHLNIPAYSDMISARLSGEKQPVILLGFSAGGSAVWHLSGRADSAAAVRGIVFYGSQIRYHRDISPGFDMNLIFPAAEPHFDVDDLIEVLSPAPGVTISRADGLHGFMNEYSKNYSRELYTGFMDTHIPEMIGRKPGK